MTFAMRLAAIVIACFALCSPSIARHRIKPNDAQVTLAVRDRSAGEKAVECLERRSGRRLLEGARFISRLKSLSL